VEPPTNTGDPTTLGMISITAIDGEPVEPTAGSSFKLDNGLVVAVMTQDDYNRWDETR
jgi:hypothetical protein